MQRSKPWLFRTYAGHSSAIASNRLYRENLSRGQTGLSVAFDLPTQTGYDPDHIMARGEVGKVGVPVSCLADMRALFDGIPLAEMNTSMTINATAPWLLALYVVVAEEQGIPRVKLAGTTQNDVVKEFLSRGTYVFGPAPSLGLTADVVAWTYREMPRWNPINVCSYHLQEAGATPVQELAIALANAIAILDAVKDSGQVPSDDFPRVVGRISFFVNAGIRFVTEICKMRAFTAMWDRITRERYGVEDAALRRFRYGVQVNSLGLTEAQPENNVYRILLETLGVVLSKDARARAVQLPAWNEALGLPRPWDQQWSLRLQQILAHETDLLEFDDIVAGNPAIEAKVRGLIEAADSEIERIARAGGIVGALEDGSLKRALVASHAERRRAIEVGEQPVVGVNCYVDSAPSPLHAGTGGGVQRVSMEVEAEAIEVVRRWRAERDDRAVEQSLIALEAAAREGCNIMEPTLACARAGVTTGEWTDALRRIHGDYRPVVGVDTLAETRDACQSSGATREIERRLNRRPRILIGKPGLDGHSNGAEQIALRAAEAGFEVIYEGIRQTPARIAELARERQPDLIGLSILSGSHAELVAAVQQELIVRELGHIPVVVGGIIPSDDAEALREAGILAVYTPRDHDIGRIVQELADTIAMHLGRRNAPAGVIG